MKTEEIALSRLVENEDNPRLITDEGFAKLVRSIIVFPKMLDIRPVVTDNTYKVLGGNMRTRALGKIRTMDAAAIRKELDVDGRFTEGEKFAIIDYWNTWKEEPTVKVVKADDLTEAQKREFIIKDNAGFGEWDFNRLANEWDDMPLVDWGVPDWAACQEGEGEERREAQEDDWKGNEAAPERVSCGDLWQLGEHRLMCGDSTSSEHVKFLCAGKQINLLITDPPYNVNYGANSTVKRQTIANDNMEAGQFQEFLTDAFFSADDVMAEGGAFYIWYAHLSSLQFFNAVNEVGWKNSQQLIWAKNRFNLGRNDYQWMHEPCIYGWKQGAAHYFCQDRTLATVWQDEKPEDYSKMKKAELLELVRTLTSPTIQTTVIYEKSPAKSDLHPTMKPVRLFAHLMQNSSREGENVLDIFGGSGTTIIAAEQMKRRAFVMELDEKYCDAIIMRWEEFTGEKAIKIANFNDKI